MKKKTEKMEKIEFEKIVNFKTEKMTAKQNVKVARFARNIECDFF